MIFLKVATLFLAALLVRAEKKIELQDIEEDNLRSEMRSELEKDHDKSDGQQTSSSGTGSEYNSLDFMKSGLLRLFENNQATPQSQRYVHQYAVTEQPERQAPVPNKVQYGPSAPQQAMVGYLSNMPMQIYLVPQYYSDPLPSPQHAEFQSPGLARLTAYQSPESVQNNYLDVPAYVPPTGKPYIQNFAPPQSVTYVTYQGQPTAPPPQATVAPVLTYQVPVLQYNPAPITPTKPPKPYYANPEYTDDLLDREIPKQYSSQTEMPQQVSATSEFPRHYNSRTPIRPQYRPHPISELPHPNPLLIQAPPSHLSHLPKTLPMYRPFNRPLYPGNDLVPNSFTARPHEHYSSPFKRRPTSLLDSYIPSSIQVEYLKRGLVKEPLAAYDAIASGRLPHTIPRHYERGFLPNQMYHTGAGGVTYGHYKRNPKIEKIPQK